MMDRFDGIRSVHYQARDPGLVWTKDPEPCIGPDSPLDSQSILTPNVVRLPHRRLPPVLHRLGSGARGARRQRLHPQRRVR